MEGECCENLAIWYNDQWNEVGQPNGHGLLWGICNPLRSEGGGPHSSSLLDMEGFLMPWLIDLVQSFPHPSLVDEEAVVPLYLYM